MQGGGISFHGSQVSRIIVPGVAWPCWALAEVWILQPPCHFPHQDSESLRGLWQASCRLALKSPPDLRSSAEAAQGTPGSLGEAILGTGYQGRNREPEPRLPGSQPLPSQIILCSAHGFLTPSFLPSSLSFQAGPRWSPVKGPTNLGH